MTRGDIYLVKKPGKADPKRQRAFVVVSRQVLIDSAYATVICAPVYTSDTGLASQVTMGAFEGLKHDSAVHCDGLVSIPKSELTNYVGSLGAGKLSELEVALRVALGIEE
jgi:mRNA interferase MazF